MKREWKPGDVAMVTGPDVRPGPVRRIYGEYPEGRNGCWYEGHGGFVRAENVISVRPLAVIDPEDREQVKRLWSAWRDLAPDHRLAQDNMQAALREFANPTPPKPEEPTGLGAVIRYDGSRWVGLDKHRWLEIPEDSCIEPRRLRWDEIPGPVEVIREGCSE